MWGCLTGPAIGVTGIATRCVLCLFAETHKILDSDRPLDKSYIRRHITLPGMCDEDIYTSAT